MLLRSLPRMARPHAVLELSVWALMAVPMGVLSGGVAGVLVATVFGGAAPAWVVAIAVALMTGAGALANVGSLGWAHWSRGRARVTAITRLQWLFSVALMTAALAPVNAVGLPLFVSAIIVAQVLWCGIVTMRASIWRLNYDRTARTVFAADNQAIVSLIQALTGGLTGWLVESNAELFRLLLGAASLCAIGSLLRLRSVRIRRERRLLTAERNQSDGERFRLGRYLSILREDRLYRRYMGWMMVLGTGNLMFTAPLILIMSRQMALTSFSQVLVTAALPTMVVPVSARLWSRVLAREHVIGFRRRNSRWYGLAMAVSIAGVLLGLGWVLFAAAIVLGIAIGGGMLGWNLGHNDFAAEERVADYLGLHISLTGLRGLAAPLIGVWFYGLLEAQSPGLGRWSLFLPLALTTTGSIGFWHFDRSR